MPFFAEKKAFGFSSVVSPNIKKNQLIEQYSSITLNGKI